MSNLTMYDSIDLSQIPADAQAVAGYTSGRWPTAREIPRRFPHARMLTIAINAAEDADTLDIEAGDATPADAAAWYERQRRRGVTRPCLYASASVMQADVAPVIQAAGIIRASVRLWSAHYTHTPHICGPRTCGAVSIDMDGTQWTDRAMGGRNLDQSLLLSGFFDAGAIPSWQEAIMNALPVLSLGAADKPGQVFFVTRMQALTACYGRINNIAAAACQEETGTFDTPTKAAVQAVQAHAHLAADGICGPLTWAALVAGQHS